MPIDHSKVPSPCFVLDEARLRKNLRLIKEVQEAAGVEVILAFKGFAMWSAFPVVKEYLNGATASSLDEARLCFEELGVRAHTYAPAYSDEQFDKLISYSSHITFNSLSQLQHFRPKLKAAEHPISYGLRVNPEFSDVKTELYNPASPYSRLGLTSEHFTENLPEGVEGLHFHVLCESTSQSLEEVLNHFEEKFGHLISQAKWVNMGGGHLMTHTGYDTKHLIRLLTNFKQKYQVKIILEPGSAIAWETGDLVSTVLDIVENHGLSTAILDVSFTCHMPDCMEMPYKPQVLGASGELIEGKPAYRLGGLSCLAGDFMEAYSFDTPLRIGDKVIFQDMIHYTMVKTNTFNGVRHPSIGIWKTDDTLQLIREFGYEDYKNRLS